MPASDLSKYRITPLEQQEQIMFQKRGAFDQFCEALFNIYTNKLWEGKYDSFAAYCENRHQFRKSRAYQMLSAARIFIAEKSTVEDSVPLISNDLQQDKPESKPSEKSTTVEKHKPIQNENQARQRIKAAKATVIEVASEVRHTCDKCNGKGWTV